MSKTKINLEDIQALEDLMDAVNKIKQHALNTNTEPTYPVGIRKETVRLRFALGVAARAMNEELGLAQHETEAWTIKYKTTGDAVGQKYGSGVRYDIPTKCLVIKKHIEDGIPGHLLAEEYNVSQGTVSNWKSQFKEFYNLYIHLPEGTMIVGKEEKRIIGLVNIKKMMLITQKTEEITKQSIYALSSLHEDSEPVEQAMKDLEAMALTFHNED